MKKIRRCIAVMLAAALALAVLSGCITFQPPEDRALEMLNNVRTQNYGLQPLTRNAEADSYAQQTVDFMETMLYTEELGTVLANWSMNLACSSVEGRGYKTSMFVYNPNRITEDKFFDQEVATNGDAAYVGMACGSLLKLKFMIITIY